MSNETLEEEQHFFDPFDPLFFIALDEFLIEFMDSPTNKGTNTDATGIRQKGRDEMATPIMTLRTPAKLPVNARVASVLLQEIR
jgi:hypothetical protein